MKRNQKGFGLVELLLILVVLGGIGFVGWRMVGNGAKLPVGIFKSKENNKQNTADQKLLWRQTDQGLQPIGTVPECPDQPMLKAPTDLSKATSVLYPGQKRGGNYKPHGGFRFDAGVGNDITVHAPIDGYLVRGASYLTDGEVQHTFDVINNCGIMYRIGHLRELPADLQKIADTWPAPGNSSATHNIHPAVYIKQGTVLGTKVGIVNANNSFFDLGVYDYRQQNQASRSPAYQATHAQDKELSWYAVCWLKGWLPESDSRIIIGLPAADPGSGKNSDYCS